MKLGSREADEAYDRWHDRMADEYFGANDEDACEICGGDQDAMNELTADAERFRALRDMSANFAWRYAEAKRNGFDLADAITADLPSIPGVVAILNAEDFTAAVDELMRSNAELTGAGGFIARVRVERRVSSFLKSRRWRYGAGKEESE